MTKLIFIVAECLGKRRPGMIEEGPKSDLGLAWTKDTLFLLLMPPLPLPASSPGGKWAKHSPFSRGHLVVGAHRL